MKEESVSSGKKSLRESWEMVINMHANVYVGGEITLMYVVQTVRKGVHIG